MQWAPLKHRVEWANATQTTTLPRLSSDMKAAINIKNFVRSITELCFTPHLMLDDSDGSPSCKTQPFMLLFTCRVMLASQHAQARRRKS